MHFNHAINFKRQPTDTSSPSYIIDKVEITEGNLIENRLQRRIEFIKSFDDIFAKYMYDEDIGYTDIKHHIDLIDNRPIKKRYKRTPSTLQDEVKSHLDN